MRELTTVINSKKTFRTSEVLTNGLLPDQVRSRRRKRAGYENSTLAMGTKSDRRMAKWAMIKCIDLLFVGAVFACATHPELIIHQWTTAHNACWELGVTVGTSLAPIRNHSFAGGALRFVASRIFWRMFCKYFQSQFFVSILLFLAEAVNRFQLNKGLGTRSKSPVSTTDKSQKRVDTHRIEDIFIITQV